MDEKDWEKTLKEAVRTHGLEPDKKGFYNALGDWVTSEQLKESWERDQKALRNGSAKKYDSDKPQLGLVPVEALEAIANAMEYGADKYGRHNYRRGHRWSRCLDAALRHLYAMAGGEEIDQESGNPHLGHAMASLAMLSYHVKHHPDLNDLFEEDENE